VPAGSAAFASSLFPADAHEHRLDLGYRQCIAVEKNPALPGPPVKLNFIGFINDPPGPKRPLSIKSYAAGKDEILSIFCRIEFFLHGNSPMNNLMIYFKLMHFC
jgi:hypothetical protein